MVVAMKEKSFSALVILMLAFGLAACGASPQATQYPTPGPNADNAEIQIYLDASSAQHTLDAVNAQMTGTAQVKQATATQQAWVANETAAARTAEANAQATEHAWQLVQATMRAADAQATSTAQAGNHIATSTAVAAEQMATATDQAANTQAAATAQYQLVQDNLQTTADANALNAVATAQSAEAEIAVLALEREQRTNTVMALAPWVLGAVGFGLIAVLLGYWVMGEINRRKIIVDNDGHVDTIYDVSRNGTRVWKPDRVTGAIISMDANGNITAPQSPAQKEATMMAMLPAILQATGGRSQGISNEFLNYMRSVIGTQPQPSLPPGEIVDVKVIDAGDPEVGGWLTDVESSFTTGNILH